MVQMVCRCLNVRISVKKDILEALDIKNLTLSDEEFSDNFLKNSLTEISQDSGITRELPFLCASRQIGQWTIFSCLSCNTETYATKGKEKIVANLTLEHNPSQIASLQNSENYSQVFKMILPQNFSNLNSAFKVSLGNNNYETTVSFIQHQIDRYLQNEQSAMEGRIKLYKEQQHANFSSLQNKVQNEKQLMLNFAAALRDDLLLEPSAPPTRIPMPKVIQHLNDEAKKMKGSRKKSNMNQNGKVRHSSHNFSKSVGVEAMFHMEGIDSDGDSTYNHSDDGDTEDSQAEDAIVVPAAKNATLPQHPYAMSLPVNIPLWNHLQHTVPTEEPAIPSPENTEEIAASIQALAVSVHDGTEMFGDLPRPRFKTIDLANF